MPVYKIKDAAGVRYLASVQDKRRGIPRVKRTFQTRKEAREWEQAVRDDAHAALMGHERRYVFGQALARYLAEDSPQKKSHRDDVYNANALRMPAWDQTSRRWVRLEQLPLDEVPAGLAVWSADQRQILRRAYLGARTGDDERAVAQLSQKRKRAVAQLYQQRKRADGRVAWYWQPHPTAGAEPKPRVEVTDHALIARLDASPGRGPVSRSTLRVRQILVKRVLYLAWRRSTKSDMWLASDVSKLIDVEAPSASRKEFLTPEQVTALVIAAGVHFDDAILAAAWIGWRRGNVVGSKSEVRDRDIEGLTWARVVFPVYDESGAEVQFGYIVSSDTKNGEPVAQPMSTRLEQLLRCRWLVRNGPYVFHQGDGRPWGDFRKRWKTAKRRAGVPLNFVWHGLRHTWTTEMLRNSVHKSHVQRLGGWKDSKMVDIYAHLQIADLRGSVNFNKGQSK